jgi:hypothetical protein
MELDAQKLTNDMIATAAGALPGTWHLVRDFAEPKLRGIAETLVAIEKEKALGKIDETRAALRIATQKKRLESVMAAVEGIEKLALERALNAALAAIREPVLKVLGLGVV